MGGFNSKEAGAPAPADALTGATVGGRNRNRTRNRGHGRTRNRGHGRTRNRGRGRGRGHRSH